MYVASALTAESLGFVPLPQISGIFNSFPAFQKHWSKQFCGAELAIVQKYYIRAVQLLTKPAHNKLQTYFFPLSRHNSSLPQKKFLDISHWWSNNVLLFTKPKNLPDCSTKSCKPGFQKVIMLYAATHRTKIVWGKQDTRIRNSMLENSMHFLSLWCYYIEKAAARPALLCVPLINSENLPKYHPLSASAVIFLVTCK